MSILIVIKSAAPPILYSNVVFDMFFVNFVFSTAAILFTVDMWPMQHGLHQTANLPNLSLFIPAVLSKKKPTFTPILFELPVDLSK